MSSKKLSEYLDGILRSVDLVPIQSIEGTKAYGFKVRPASSLMPIFLPHVVTIGGTPILTGVLGLARYNSRLAESEFAGERILSCHSANFPGLLSLQEFGESLSRDVAWCEALRTIMEQFPRTDDDVMLMLETNSSIAGVKISTMIHQQV